MQSLASLPINIYATKDLYQASEKVEKALEFLKDSLKYSCGINLNYKINVKNETLGLGKSFKSDSYHKVYKTKFGSQKFIYFQYDFYKYLEQNQLLKNDHGITFHYVEDVYGHCGFAFPAIQFKKMNSPKIKKALKNNILISRGATGCGNSSRLLTHEMAHILVQDDPAHMCGNKKCGEENILSVHRVKPAINPPFGMGGGHMNNFGGMSPIPYANELVPSIGRDFDSSQCSKVKSFLKEYM
jgi:hypothetical protein